MENQEITIETILSVFKNSKDRKKAKDIKTAIKDNNTGLFSPIPDVDLIIERLLKEDRQLNEQSELIYSNGYYQKRKKKSSPADGPSQKSNYIGAAGECAVMSELLYRDYNVNRMLIDEGIDLIATKDNLYYYIQVKTTTVRNGAIYAQIDSFNYDNFMGKQMRYYIVARTIDHTKMPKNIFFKFTQEDIERGIYGRYIKKGEKVVSIKIKFDEKTGSPKLYDDKEQEISWNMNNFNL